MLILFSLIVFVAKPLGVERLLWQEKYFNVSVPKIDSPENTIVVIAGKRPWAYMIPSFPESVRFLRIGGNFTGSKRKNNYISEMKSIIKKHTGVIYLLSRRKFLEKEVYLLRSYRLFMTQSTPRLIRSIHERPGLFLWQLEKK